MYATLNGIQIYYEDFGRGQAVLLTHGYGATCGMWEPQRRALQTKYRLIGWDMRGHGRTESPQDPTQYSAALTVEDQRSLLDHQKVDRAVVGGLSLGGYMALAFYHRYPERVRALILCNSGPGYRDPAARAKWNEAAEQRARALERLGLAALEGGSPEMRRAMEHHRSDSGLVHAARGMLIQSDDAVINMLAQVRVPTLVVVGDEDTLFLVPCRYMAQKIPGARLEIIPEAGHASNLDQPERFNQTVLDFLDRLP